LVRHIKFVLGVLLIGLTVGAAMARTGSPSAVQLGDENDPARAAALIKDAIAARGGAAYLKIRTVVSHGEYTPYAKGVSTVPDHFVDRIVYPDRERTDFGSGSSKTIQTNVGNHGWVYDGMQKQIHDQTEAQVKQFQQGARYDLDNILRGGWQAADAKLVYMGRREAWRNTFAEAVRIEFADGATVIVDFDPRTKLPIMTEFKTIRDEGTTSDQVRYYQWLDFNGIKFPKIQDSYRDGKQTSRTYFDDVSFNLDIPDRVFEKPGSVKEIK
jgi:hypothetical protein